MSVPAIAAFLALASVSPSAQGYAGPPQLLSFGDASYGVLGRRPDLAGDLASAPTALSLPGQIGTVIQVASGGGHSLVVTSSGQLFGFGENYWGALGSARDFREKLPSPQPALVPLPGGVAQVAAGTQFSLARTPSGQLYAFGEDRAGELGVPASSGEDGNADPTPSPVSLPASEGGVAQIAAGADFSLALTAAGQLYSFGENEDGQLGQPRNEGTENANPAPAIVALPAAAGRVTQIAAGGTYALALTATGQLYGWGADKYGQTGDAPNLGNSKPDHEPHPIALPAQDGAITGIAAGAEDSLALTSTGQVYTFGDDDTGELGRPVARRGGEQPEATPTLVTLPGATGVAVRVAAGSSENFVQTSDDQIYGFGSNLYGELGILTNLDDGGSYATPTALIFPGFSNVELLGDGPSASASFVAGDPQAPSDAPVLSGLKITPTAVELNAHGNRCYTPYGADPKHHCSRTSTLRIDYALSQSATVTFVVEREASSILQNGECQQEGASRHRVRCSFLVLRGRFRQAVPAGAQTLPFDGLIERRVLQPGRYRLTAFPQAGQETGASESVWFQVSS